MRIKTVVALFVCLSFLYPQGATSPISGKVSDAQAALVPNAEITVTNVSTGQVFTTTTNERGSWVLPAMPPADYRVTVK
ncbi:MAG TPA: carboxypeptidase-like regulatory domain-containing protein, partial [Bryobacteraceae bacterium]|nr:carboxypeptidase-like regulatory domain-containing protein [Bryobacteraceae bacterium]